MINILFTKILCQHYLEISGCSKIAFPPQTFKMGCIFQRFGPSWERFQEDRKKGPHFKGSQNSLAIWWLPELNCDNFEEYLTLRTVSVSNCFQRLLAKCISLTWSACCPSFLHCTIYSRSRKRGWVENVDKGSTHEPPITIMPWSIMCLE